MDHGSQKYTDLKYSEWRKIIVHTIHQDHQEVFLLRSEPDYIISHLQDRTSTSFECQMKDLQGVYRWVRLIFSRVPSVEDDASRFVYMVQDIHDESLRLIKDMKKYE